MFKPYPYKTGLMFIDNYDMGIVQSIGHDLGLAFDTSDPELPCFRVNIPGTSTGTAHIVMGDADVVFIKKKFPAIIITRNDFSPALERWMGVGQLEYKVGINGTQSVINGVSGFMEHEEKLQAVPYNIPYTISLFDLTERNVQAMLKKVLKAFYPTGKLFCKDSLGLDRTYDVEVEGSVSQINEIVDASRRVKGYSVDILVLGELDLNDPYETNGVSGFTLNVGRLY